MRLPSSRTLAVDAAADGGMAEGAHWASQCELHWLPLLIQTNCTANWLVAVGATTLHFVVIQPFKIKLSGQADRDLSLSVAGGTFNHKLLGISAMLCLFLYFCSRQIPQLTMKLTEWIPPHTPRPHVWGGGGGGMGEGLRQAKIRLPHYN